MDLNELAKSLFGKDKSQTSVSPGMTTTVYGTAMSDSENGEVQVFISDDAVGPDFGADPDATVITLPTSPSVKMGDTVAVTLLGGGAVKHPYVSAVIGSGDRISDDLDNAVENSTNALLLAQLVATLTGQYFWYDDYGAHVTEVPETEWNDVSSENYHSGNNVLINSQGQLFRNGEAVLLGIYNNGLEIYDGSGITDTNVLTKLTESSFRVGPLESNNFTADNTGLSLNTGWLSAFSVQHNIVNNDPVTVAVIGNPGGYYHDTMVATFAYEANDRGWYPSATSGTNRPILDSSGVETGYTIGRFSSGWGSPIYNRYGQIVSSEGLSLGYSVTRSSFETETIFSETEPHKVQLDLEQAIMYGANDNLFIVAEGSSEYGNGYWQGLGLGSNFIFLGGPTGESSSATNIRIRGPINQSNGSITSSASIITTGGSFIRKNSNLDITTDVETATGGTLATYQDANSEMIGQIRAQQFTNSRDGIEIVARNRSRDGNNTIRQNVLALYVTPDGTSTYSVTSPANFRNAIGASSGKFNATTVNFGWTSLGSFTGESSLTISLTNYSEVCVAAKANGKLVTATLPKALLTTSSQELWLGGGKSSGATANSGNLRAVVNVTTTKVTGVNFSEGNTNRTSSTTWYVYAR